MGLWRIYPTAHSCSATQGTGTGTHTAAGVWSQSSADCASAVNESVDALDESLSGFIRSHITYYNPGYFEWVAGAPPSGITITKVRIVAWLRASSGNNATIVETPRLKGFVNPNGTRYYQASPAYFLMTRIYINRQQTGPVGTFSKFTAGEWPTNPATGSAWTLSDLAAGVFKFGIACGGIAEGQAGNGCPPTPGANQASLDVALACLEIEGTPSELVTDPIRGMLSLMLWLKRQRLRTVEVDVTPPNVDLALGDVFYLDDRRFPTGDGLGLSRHDWSARPLFVVGRSSLPGGGRATIKAWDLHELIVSNWSPLHTDLGADDGWSGIAWIDRGGGRTVARAQGGWVHRPNDFFIRDVPAGKWRITPWGWSICGGSYSGYTPSTGELFWHTLNNTFSQGTGGEGTSLANGDTTGFTNWTVAKGGGGSVVIKVETSYLFDVTGYRRAVRVSSGATPATDYGAVSAAGSALSTMRVRVCIKFRPVGSATPGDLCYVLRRATAPTDWDQANGVWGAATIKNKVSDGVAIGAASLRKCGDHYEYWSSDITVGANGSLTLWVGYPASANASFDIFAASVVSTGAAVGAGAAVLRRDFLVTTTAALSQAGDVVDLDNQEAYRIWDASRGTWSVMFTPLWDHEDLVDGAPKVIVCANHQATANDREYLCYTRTNSTAGAWLYVRIVGGITTTASLVTSSAAGTLPRRWTPTKLTIRWTSAAGEFGLAPHTQSIWVDGVKGTDAIAGGESSQLAVGSYVALGRSTTGAAGSAVNPYSMADGFLAHLKVRPFCLTDDEIARLHAQMALGNPLPTAA